MGIDITLYLTRPGTTLENIIQQDKIGENEGQYFAIGVRENADLPLEHTCFVKRPQLNGTRWSDWLGSTFEFGELIPQNQSTGCVLSLHIGGRVFVLAFGTGRHAIRPTAIEYDFGLRVALHKVDPQRLRNLISKTVDIRTIERSTYHHTGGPVIDFSMDLDVEWLRSVEGVAAPGEAFTAAAGTDAIRLKNYSRPLAEIADLCQNLLSAYQADVPESFAFANNVRPVATKDPLHQTLEEEFVAMVNGGNRDGLEVIVDWAVVDRMASARLYFSHTDAAVNELSADQIWTGVNALIAQLPDLEASRIKLEIFDENQERVKLFSLLDVVQAELLYLGETYLRIERRWFSVGEDYVQQINRRVQDLPVPPHRKVTEANFWRDETKKINAQYSIGNIEIRKPDEGGTVLPSYHADSIQEDVSWVLGYSERGIVNALLYEIQNSENSNQLIKILLEHATFPYRDKVDFNISTAEILIEQSFSDFGDADIVFLLNTGRRKITVFAEAKVKPSQTPVWKIKDEFDKFVTGTTSKLGSSNLFTQLYHKLRMIDTLSKGGLASLKNDVAFPTCSSMTLRKIGSNPVVLRSIKKVSHYLEDAYFLAIVPDKPSNLEDFFSNDLKHSNLTNLPGWNLTSYGYLAWSDIMNFCADHKLEKTLRVFKFNEGQIF